MKKSVAKAQAEVAAGTETGDQDCGFLKKDRDDGPYQSTENGCCQD
jgi:hypothetical protein